MRISTTPVLLLMAALASCGPANNEPGPGGVSVEDARALDEAAEQLDGQTSADRNTDTEAE